MSTEIFMGFKMKCGLASAGRKALAFREVIHEKARSAYETRLVERAVFALDRGSVPAWEAPLDWAASMIVGDLRDLAKGTRNPEIDWQCDVVFLPHGKETYGVVITEQSEWFDLWLARSGAKEFAYWDHTDSLPNGVTGEEWEHRRDVWTSILAPSWSPGALGVTVQCGVRSGAVPPKMRPGTKSIEADLPSSEQRVERIVEDRILKEVVAALEKGDPQWEEKGFFPLMEALNSEVADRRRKEIRSGIRGALREYTLADLAQVVSVERPGARPGR